MELHLELVKSLLQKQGFSPSRSQMFHGGKTESQAVLQELLDEILLIDKYINIYLSHQVMKQMLFQTCFY